MSIQKRKIAYYSIEFNCGDEKFFKPKLFCDFLKYINNLSDGNRIFNDTKSKKAVDFDRIKEETIQGIHMFKVVFKSCKYNHSPDYMSSIDGSERQSDKKLDEGEKELTHACFKITSDEAYTIFEQRKNGVSIGSVIKYFNKLLKEFLLVKNITERFYLFASLIPADDFITTLNNVERIIEANIYTEQKVLGSDFLNLMPLDPTMKDELVISVKAKRGESITKRAVKQTFYALTTEGTVTNRIRIHAKDTDKLDVMLDSLETKKIDEITVELNENGIVNTYSIFSKIEELMGVSE